MEENNLDTMPTAEPTAEPTTQATPEPPKAEPKPNLAPPEKKTVTKELFDKTASEVAELKRQLRERMTADELKAAQAEEARMELETLRREKEVAKLEVSLAKSGIENSGEIAELFANGEVGHGIAALTKAKDKQIADLKKQLTLAEQRGAMTPPVGEPNNEFAGKTLSELMIMANQNPALEERIAAYLAATKKE